MAARVREVSTRGDDETNLLGETGESTATVSVMSISSEGRCLHYTHTVLRGDGLYIEPPI